MKRRIMNWQPRDFTASSFHKSTTSKSYQWTLKLTTIKIGIYWEIRLILGRCSNGSKSSLKILRPTAKWFTLLVTFLHEDSTNGVWDSTLWSKDTLTLSEVSFMGTRIQIILDFSGPLGIKQSSQGSTCCLPALPPTQIKIPTTA
jgi:hypothetical protein